MATRKKASGRTHREGGGRTIFLNNSPHSQTARARGQRTPPRPGSLRHRHRHRHRHRRRSRLPSATSSSKRRCSRRSSSRRSSSRCSRGAAAAGVGAARSSRRCSSRGCSSRFPLLSSTTSAGQAVSHPQFRLIHGRSSQQSAAEQSRQLRRARSRSCRAHEMQRLTCLTSSPWFWSRSRTGNAEQSPPPERSPCSLSRRSL